MNIDGYIEVLTNICNLYIKESLLEENDKLDYSIEDGFISFFYNNQIISSTRIENGITEILKIFTHITKSIIGNRNPDIDIENYMFEWVK